MLTTLGYRIPAEHVPTLLGQVTSYPWGPDFTRAWGALSRTTASGRGPQVLPYSQLLTGLTAVHGQPVRILAGWQMPAADRADGIDGMIVSSADIDPFHLRTCLTAFERCLHPGQDPDSLARAMPDSPIVREFQAHMTRSNCGTAAAPAWVFETAVWAIMRRLTSSKLALDDRALALRMDTDANVLGWEDLLSHTWSKAGFTGHAMLRVDGRIITLPGDGDLAIVFDAHLSRISDQWRGTRHTWMDRDTPGAPILRLPVRHVRNHEDGTWNAELANHAAAIAEACGMERLGLDQQLPSTPGRLRPQLKASQRHPIGKGPGARLMLRLAEHIERTCPELQPLDWHKSPKTRVRTPSRQVLTSPGAKEATVHVDARLIVEAARAGGGHEVRLLCLYATSNARHRMTTQLSTLAAEASLALDDHEITIAPGLTVSLHHVPKVLAHGPQDREALAADLEPLRGRPGCTTVAWVETEFEPGQKIENDAKNPLRRLLAARGIASQFISTPPPDTDEQKARARNKPRNSAGAPSKDHPAMAAAADLLLRTIGVLHPHLSAEILQDFLSATAHESVHLVGLHSRVQQATGKGSSATFVTTATAIHAHREPERLWTVRMWSDKAGQWVPQPQGLTDFHAGTIGSTQRSRSGSRAADTRIYLESVLDALPAGPVVIMLDAVSFRTIYPGLQNSGFREGALPAANLRTQRDTAIVRINTTGEVPRPVDRQGGHRPADPRQPASPDRYVYRLDGSDIWLMPKSSRIYRSKGGSLGALYTPWNLPENQQYKIQDDWHAHRATEIAVPCTGPWDAQDLVMLTARFCDHTITWDDRTLAPMPLHLATRADLTHPAYRSDDTVDD